RRLCLRRLRRRSCFVPRSLFPAFLVTSVICRVVLEYSDVRRAALPTSANADRENTARPPQCGGGDRRHRSRFAPPERQSANRLRDCNASSNPATPGLVCALSTVPYLT